jgi:hypothetical protein
MTSCIKVEALSRKDQTEATKVDVKWRAALMLGFIVSSLTASSSFLTPCLFPVYSKEVIEVCIKSAE